MWRKLVVLGLLTFPVAADDTSEIRSLMGRSLHAGTLRVAEDWAMCGDIYFLKGRAEAEGTALLHRMDGRWQKLLSVGGAMDPATAYQYGLPRRLAPRMGWPGHPGKFKDGPYWPELSNSKVLQDDLRAIGRDWIFTLMRNEVFARHGHVFSDPEMRNYFRQRAWYVPGKESPLSALELANVKAIADYQQSHRLP